MKSYEVRQRAREEAIMALDVGTVAASLEMERVPPRAERHARVCVICGLLQITRYLFLSNYTKVFFLIIRMGFSGRFTSFVYHFLSRPLFKLAVIVTKRCQ